MSRTAAALIIGNEILSGKIQETNLVELARVLRELGIDLKRVVVVTDELATIAKEVTALASTHDFVFTSGGVGPTHDDVTMVGIASAFNVPVVTHPTLEDMLRRHFGDRINDNHLRLALVPQGARLLSKPDSLWPVTVIENVWILPGIPEVFRKKLEIAREHLAGDSPFLSRAVYTMLDETDLAPMLNEVVLKHPDVGVGSYPAWSDKKYRTKLTFDGKDGAAIGRAVDDFLALLPKGEPRSTE
ncbi:MAG TPA: molybdopterin-binding protein [Vicinamibacteria bacterium]|jgi:molybdenum cofactor synthesis domain-containing protein